MSPSYSEPKVKIEKLREKLVGCAERLSGIEAEEKGRYPNPRLRLWSEDARDLEEFATGLEEWLSEPRVAEAKRYLSDLRRWSEVAEKTSLGEVEEDWRFLSDNVGEIELIHRQVEGIGYMVIKKRVSVWVLDRIKEKDVGSAVNWATNAKRFADSVKDLEDRTVESKLGHEVRKDVVRELQGQSSFQEYSEERMQEFGRVVDRADNLIKNKPSEIQEKAIVKTYKLLKEETGAKLDKLSGQLGNVTKLLVDSEWLKGFADFRDYRKLWVEKQEALTRNDLEEIAGSLRTVIVRANLWKKAREMEMHSARAKIQRMSRSLDRKDLTKEVSDLGVEASSIDWNKPSLESVSKVLSKADSLLEELRKGLVATLQSKDAILIIEEPDIVEDLGEKKAWGFDRFIEALGIVLSRGLIEIQAVEEK